MMSLKKMVSIFLVFAVVLTIGLPIYADEMRENSEKAEAVSDPPELPQTGAAPPDGGTPDEAAAEEPVPDGTAPDGTVPDGTVPDESVAAGDPAPPSESAGQNEDPVSPAEEAAGYAKNLSSPESIEALAGISPQEAGADLEVGVNPTATGTTGLSGKALQVRINSKVTGAPGGYLLILPILSEGPNDDKHTSMSSSGSFSVQYAGVNYAEDIPDFPNNTAVTIPGTSEKLDNAMLIWVPTAGGAADRPATYVNYTFADGLTPDGKSIDVKAWIVEAEGVTNNAPGRVASPALQSSSASVVKLTALANEAWEASKSITQPATAADQVFTDLRDRSYADVMTPDAEDSWTITYKVDVRSNKASGDQGRLYMQSVSVTDTLVSYGQGAPTSVKVYDQADTELGKYTVADVDGTTKRITWSADIPSQPAYLQNQTYYIKAIYNKNQYTKMLNGSGPPAVQSITNTAEVSYVPVVQPGATSTQSVADAAIGWKQMEPARPSLGISKYLKISGERRPYTAKLKQTYQKTPNVEFRLQEVDPADMTTPRPATSPLVAPLVTNETESTVSFANLYPGVYRLRETVGISSDVDIVTPSSLAASGPGALVIVTEPDMNGISKLYIDPPFPGDLSNPANIPADYTPASKIYEVTNESSKVGSLRIYPLAQQAFQYPSAYDDYYTTVIPNTAAPIQLMDGSVAVASGIADSTDSAGHYIRFENVPLNPSASSYTIKADGIDTNYYLKATRPYSETEPGSSGSNDVSVSSGEIKVYKAFMNRNKGGFVAGKIFTDSSGKALSPQPANFVASYKLYRDTGLANPLTSDAEDFTVSSANPAYIMKEFPAGVYYIKEVGLKIGGSDAGDLYSLEQSGKVKVEITAESFRAYPVDTDGNFPDNPNGHVTGGKAPWTGSDSSLTGGVFINRSLYAELAIQDFNYSGSAKAGNQYFISQTSGSGFTAKAITIPAGGLYKELVPAGTYSVEPYNVSGALRLHRSMNGDHSLVSGTTTLTVAPQTAAQPLVSVSNGNIIHGDSVQTVAFVWRYPPRLEGFKYRRDNLAGGNIPATASFSMYLLVTEQGTTTYKRTNLRATSDSTGHFIFNGYLEAGTWLLVETDLPGGAFMAPGYWPVFDLPGEPLAIVSRSAVDSLPADRAPVKIVIDESMYGGEENPTVKLSGDVYNVPYNLVNFIKTSSDASASRLPGVEFKVYRTLENARNDTASVQTVTTDSTGTAPVGGLAPGIYYVKETASAKHYILPDVITKIDINDNGWPTVTWEGQPPPASTIGESAPSNGSSVPVTTNVTLTNIRRPDLNFVKLGETSEWKSAVERQTELLPGAKFTLKDQDGNYYKMNDDGTLTNEGRSPSTIPYIISGTDGQINFKGMDPSKEYKLEEVEAPAIPGADAGADLKYTLTSADIKFKLSDEGTVWLVEKPSGPKPSPVGVYYELIDRIEPHHLRISKLPLKLHDGANRSNGFDVSHDATAPNFGEVQIIGGKFNIWVMNEEPAGSGNWVKGKLVNNLTIGNGNLGSSHYAWSRELPNGHYWVEEIETPESFSDFDVWDEAGTKGNQTSSVYVNVNGSGKPNKEKTIMPSQDPGWLEMPKHGIEIVITSEDEKIIDVVFGNSNEYAPPGWMAKHRNIRMYGEKDGYGMGITGIYEWASVIANAEFDVYPAFVDSSGAYHALPTVDGKPLTQVKTNDFAGGDLGYGQFMTDYFDISQAFYYGGQDWTDAAASSGPNPFVQFPLNTELSSSDNRIVPNGGEVIDWGKVSDDIKHKYANSYKSWSLIFIETAGTHLNNPGGTPPTSGAYEFDPSNPPTFGFTISNEDTTWTDLYENGNSNDVAIADAVPFHLKNYKGTGYIQFHKRAANSSSDLAGAVFSVYRCDPGDIDSSGNFKDGDVKKAFENASHVTNWSSSADPALKETTLKVTPGYYIIRESAAPAGLNDFGEWKTENFKGIAASERKGEFTSSLDNDGALDASDIIGPVVVYPTEQAGNWLQSTSLTVSDKVKPSVDIRNRWNGAIINDEGYSGTYDVTAPDGYFATGTTGKLVSKAEKTDATLSPLKDGIYTAKLAAAPAGISRTDYIQNAAASANEITFAVANSQVVTSGLLAPKLNGTAIPNNMEAAMTDGTGVWFTVDNGLVSIHVNHPSKGALVVRKGGISSEGGGRPAEADFSWQRINADGSDYAGPEPGPYSGSIKWAVAQDSVKTALEKGLYKVTETSTSTGWIKDDAPVYVQINETGEVYLRNNSATDGVLSSADKPLMPSVMATPEYFYNRSEEGTVEIKKFTSASDTQNLTDAEFDLFPTADGTTPSGPAAVHIVDSDPTPAAQYVATVPAGDYLIRETKAPTGRARRAEFIPVTVQPARQPEYVGYDNPANVNVKAVLNPLPINIRVAKETIYPAIGTPDALGYIPERRVRVVLLPMYLWHLKDGKTSNSVTAGDYDSVPGKGEALPGYSGYWATNDQTTADSPDEIGVTGSIPIMSTGEYRVTEQIAPLHDYLLSNPKYKMSGYTDGKAPPNQDDIAPDTILGNSGNTNLNVVYDAATNSLKVETDNGDWDADTNTLTIQNPFSGYVLLAQKLDYFTGEMVTLTATELAAGKTGAKFALYDDYNAAVAGDTTPGSGHLLEIREDAEGKGYVQFTPGFATEDKYFWVREIAPPSGYELDPWYDDAIKQLVVSAEGGPASGVRMVSFVDGPQTPAALTVEKTVMPGEKGAADGPAVTELSSGGFSTTYKVTQKPANNSLPLYSYVVNDGSATNRMFTFMGRNASNTEIEVPDVSGNNPGYRVTGVRIHPSVSFKSAKDEKNNAATPVYARVNGGAWQMLSESDATSFSVPAGTDQYLSVEYTDDKDATVPFVGTKFTPGAIEADVVFDKFQPTAAQTEVSRIVNTVTTDAAAKADGSGALVQSKDDAAIEIKVSERPVMKVDKTKTAPNYNPSTDPRNKVFAGSEGVLRFELKLTNATPSSVSSDLVIEDPVIMDYMQPETLTLHYYDANPDYTAYLNGEPYLGKVEFVKLSPNIYTWRFPDVTLHRDDYVSVELGVNVAKIVATPQVLNEVYGTSHALPLKPSLSFPTGASFVAANMASAEAVYEGNPASKAYWDKLAAIPGTDTKAFGLWVKSEAEGVTITNNGEITTMKSLQVNNGDFTASKTPVDIDIDDKVTFKLALQNDQQLVGAGGNTLTNIRVTDVLPRLTDGRGTDWTDQLRDYWKIDINNIKIYTLLDGDVKDKVLLTLGDTVSPSATSGQPLASDSKSMMFNFGDFDANSGNGTTFDDKGHYKLKPHDILYVEYSMGFDLSAIEANAALKTLYSDNNLKVAVNNYTPYYQVILEEGGSQMLTDDGFLKSNDVAVRLAAPRVSVSGETWEDMNYNGLKDGPLDTADPLYEKPTGGVSVTLYRRVNGGAVTLVTAEMSSDPLFESTVKTGADGKYIFHGLESSYNTGIEYMVQFGLPDGDGWLRTLKDAPGGTSLPDAASDANDSDAMQSGLLAGNTDWYTVNTDRDNIWAGYNKLGVLNGMAWYDYNGDGIQDASETDYAAGVKVSLYTSAAAAEAGGATGADYVASAVTGTDGKYSFGNLMAVKQGTSTPAAYHVRFDKSDLKADAMTYNWTAELQDTDRQKDSDPSPFDMALPGYTADYSVPVAVTKNAANVPYGGTTSYVDAGLLPVTKAIGGYVWTDKNYDGIQNGPGLSPPAPEPELYESPISGVAVELYGSSDSGASWDSKPVATAVTGANGRFEFTGPDGDPTAGLSFGVGKAYRIKILKPDDTWYYTLKDQGSDDDKDSDVFDTGTDAGFSATITEPMVNLGAGLYQLGEISGKVWFDQNGDGSKAGETFDPKPAGVTAKLYTSADGTTGWAEKASKLVTATDDDFTFAELKSGHYKVVFDRTGLTSSTETYLWTVPNAPGVAKDENSDAVYTNNTDMAAESAPLELGYHSSDGVSQDAGIIIRLNHIKGRVWEDMNFDGLQNGPASDSDPMYEKPLSVDVELWKSVDSGKTWGSAPFAKMKSGSSDGTYGYYGNSGGTVGLETGSGVMYQVRFGKPNDGANWAYTEYRTGYPGSAGIDSDALRDTGFTEAITLMAGGNTNIDAGEYKTAAVRGLVWRDADFDGIRQSGDAGYKGVKVNLSYTDLTSASVSLDTATDADGKYSFENLKASRPGTGFTVTFDRSPLTSGTEMYKWAPPNAGSDASVNSDAVYAADAKADLTAAYTSADDPDTADVDEREIKYARAAENIDAGITPYLHVKGFTWHDDDLNGAMNGEEEVFPDIATRLYMDGKQVGETVTGADGSYEFDDILILGREHSVSFDNPDYETWRFTVPGVHHTATDLKGAVAGNINYFKEAHTKGAVLTGHSDSIWNAGLNRIPSYKVTYRPNGGTGPWGPGDYSITVKAGSLVPDQSVNRDGYTFLGWYSTDYLKKNWHFVSDLMPERDIVLDASWQMIPVEKPPAPRRPVNPGQLRNPPVNQDQPGDPVSVPVKKTAKPKPGNAKKPDTYGLGSQGTPGGRGVYDWSLLSLLMSVTAVLIGILAIIGYILKNRWKRYYSEEEQGDEGLPAQTDGEEPGAVEGYYKRSLILRILVCFFGVLTPIIFILLDDMTLPMVWVNLWTPCVALSFVLQLVFLAVYRFRKIKKEEDVEKEDSDE